VRASQHEARGRPDCVPSDGMVDDGMFARTDTGAARLQTKDLRRPLGQIHSASKPVFRSGTRPGGELNSENRSIEGRGRDVTLFQSFTTLRRTCWLTGSWGSVRSWRLEICTHVQYFFWV